MERIPGIEVVGIPDLNAIGTILKGATWTLMAKAGLGRMQQLGKIRLEAGNDFQADIIGGMQKGRCGKPTIHDHVLRKTRSELSDNPLEQPLPGGILTITWTIRLHIYRQ